MGQMALTSPDTDPGGPNAGFVRPGAALAIIVVTNEDDSSFGTPEHYARAFESMKGKGNEMLVSFSVIGGTRPDGCYAPGEQGLYGSKAEPAWRYAEVSTRVGGIIGSICDTSFERTLVQIAQALNTLKRVFPLTLPPIVGSIHVSVISGGVTTPVPQDLVNGWQYQADTNSIVFLGSYIPPPGSTVRIDYAFSRPWTPCAPPPSCWACSCWGPARAPRSTRPAPTATASTRSRRGASARPTRAAPPA